MVCFWVRGEGGVESDGSGEVEGPLWRSLRHFMLVTLGLWSE